MCTVTLQAEPITNITRVIPGVCMCPVGGGTFPKDTGMQATLKTKQALPIKFYNTTITSNT